MSEFHQATDPSAPAETLIELSKNESINVRWAVANNLNTPAETLVELAMEEGWMVRGAALMNPNCPETIKMWFKMGGYAGLSLAEFVAGTDANHKPNH